MNIAIDLRSLHTSEFSGVESYTVNMLEQLLEYDRSNVYTLFYNGFKPKRFDYFHFINAHYKQTRVPNRLLNLAIKFSNRPHIESLIGPCDVLLMPNWNMLSIKPYTKVLLTVHDLSPLMMPEMYNAKARAWHAFINIPKLVNRADRIFAVSEYTKQSLMDVLQVPAQKIITTPLGVQRELYHSELAVEKLREVRNRYNLPGDFILFVGTIEPRKNLVRLLQAFEALPGNVELVIAGKWGWKYDEVVRLIQRSSKRRQIKILGYVPEADKPYIMRLARVFAWPTLYEGFGLPVLEAMAVGTPVLTSSVTSLPEVVEDAALIVNPYNVNDIASGLEQLLHNESLRRTYVARGVHRSRLFDWKNTAGAVQDTINRL